MPMMHSGVSKEAMLALAAEGGDNTLTWASALRRKRERPRTANPYALQRRVGFGWLRFEPELERKYRTEFIDRNAARIRLSNGVALLALAGYLLLDKSWSMSPLAHDVRIVMLWSIVPALLLPVLATYLVRLTHRAQAIAYIGTFVLSVSAIAATLIGTRYNPEFPYETLILVTMYVYFLSGLLYYQAVVCAAVIALCYVGIHLWLQDRGHTLVVESYFLLLTNLIGWVGCYMLERQDRHSYLLYHELRNLAVRDSLTDLLNRRAFRHHMARVWMQAIREGKKVGIAVMDVDHFKRINDRCGHPFGDEVLRRVGTVLRSMTRRPLDAASRYGGDEFIAVWYDVDTQWMRGVGETFRAELAELALTAGVPNLRVTMSGGGILTTPVPGARWQDAIRMADERLYEVKRTSRNAFSTAEWVPGLVAEPATAVLEQRQAERRRTA
jgi:diguanylate cyclase (GGDEF)-like protein